METILILAIVSLVVLLALGMAVMPRRAIAVERALLHRLRLISRERRDRRPGMVHTVFTSLVGVIVCGIGLIGLAVTVAVLMFVETVKTDLHASPEPARAVFRSGWNTASPLADATQTSITGLVVPLLTSGENVGIVVGAISGNDAGILGFGRTAIDRSDQPDGKTLFEIGSVTKAFTASALACMEQGGKVRLDQPVAELLPPGTHMPEHNGKHITLLHLVTQTSGLPRLPTNLFSFGDYATLRFLRNPYSGYSPERLLNYLNTASLGRAPGSEYDYSNLGMGLLGYALSQKRGQSYEAMVRELVCSPLGMKDTVVAMNEDQRARLAKGYHFSAGEAGELVAMVSGPWDMQDTIAGAGALRSTAEDMLIFIAANLGTGDTTLTATLERTHESRHRISDDLAIAMAWHIFPEVAGITGPIIWHNGQTGGHTAFVAIHKPSRSGVVVLCNTASATAIDIAGIKILKLLVANSTQPGKSL